jgi:hypothetical protein
MSIDTPNTLTSSRDDEELGQMQRAYDSERIRALEDMRQAYAEAVAKIDKLSFTHDSP